MLERTAEGYDGTAPFPDTEPPAAATARPVPVAVTAAIAGVPFAGIVAALWLACGNGVGLVDMLADGGVIGWVATHRRQTAA